LSADELARFVEHDDSAPDQLTTELLEPHPALAISGHPPIVLIEPKPDAASEIALNNLVEWAKSQSSVLTKGAAIFRGFETLRRKPANFELFAQAFADDLQDIYLGHSPRLSVDGTKTIFTSAEFAREFPIQDHAEMSFLPTPPRLVMFSCFEISNKDGAENILPGGETALIDYAKLWSVIDPEVKERLVQKGFRYIRRYPHKKNWPTLDPRFSKSWNAMFGTDDKAEVESISQVQGFNVSWGNDELLTLTNEGPAYRVHPTTGIAAFHGHLHVFDKNGVPDGLALAAKHHEENGFRRAAWRFIARRAVVLAVNWVNQVFLGDEAFGTLVAYGDGTPIPETDKDHIRRLAWHLVYASPHREGDVDVIDNFRIAHSRIAFDLFSERTLHATWTGGFTSTK